MRGILVICLFSSVILSLTKQANAFCMIEHQGQQWGLLFVPSEPVQILSPEPKVSYAPTARAQRLKPTISLSKRKKYNLMQPGKRKEDRFRYETHSQSVALSENLSTEEKKDFSEMNYNEREEFTREILKKKGLLNKYLNLKNPNSRRKNYRYENIILDDNCAHESLSNLDSIEYNSDTEDDNEYSDRDYTGEDGEYADEDEESEEYDEYADENEELEEFGDYSDEDDEFEEFDVYADENEESEEYDEYTDEDKESKEEIEYYLEGCGEEDGFLKKFDKRTQKHSNSKDKRKLKKIYEKEKNKRKIILALEEAGWIFVYPQASRYDENSII